MDGFDSASTAASTRDSSGRFLPGASGNPAGKRPGTRNRKTILREALRDGEDAGMARVVIDKALAGDAVTARFCLAILDPKPKGRLIELDLPEEANAGDVLAAFDATLAAMAAGEITPDEALVVTRVLDGRRRAIETLALERSLAQREPEATTAPVADAAKAPIHLHSACISPPPADDRSDVARLPRAERRRIAALAARRHHPPQRPHAPR